MLKVHKLNDLSFFFSQLREKNKQGGLLRRLKEMKAPNLSSITTPSRWLAGTHVEISLAENLIDISGL